MQTIKINLIPNGKNPTCSTSQYDTGRVIRCELVDGATPYTIKTGDVITLNLRKPDDTIVTSVLASTVGNPYVDIVTTEQMTACKGFNKCEVSIANGDTKIGSGNFTMSVEEDVLSDGIESESEIHDLDAKIKQAVSELGIGEWKEVYVSPIIDTHNLPSEYITDGSFTPSAPGQIAFDTHCDYDLEKAKELKIYAYFYMADGSPTSSSWYTLELQKHLHEIQYACNEYSAKATSANPVTCAMLYLSKTSCYCESGTLNGMDSAQDTDGMRSNMQEGNWISVQLGGRNSSQQTVKFEQVCCNFKGILDEDTYPMSDIVPDCNFSAFIASNCHLHGFFRVLVKE